MEITRDVLVQYCALKAEIKDLNQRIEELNKKLERIREEGMVSDTVRGTRRDGTIGPIKITGYPLPEHETVKTMIKKRIAKLHILEEELHEAVNAVDDFINTIPNSELRMILRFYYLDDMTWPQVALNMNYRFPKRRIKYTEDNCRKRHDRYLEKEYKI